MPFVLLLTRRLPLEPFLQAHIFSEAISMSPGTVWVWQRTDIRATCSCEACVRWQEPIQVTHCSLGFSPPQAFEEDLGNHQIVLERRKWGSGQDNVSSKTTQVINNNHSSYPLTSLLAWNLPASQGAEASILGWLALNSPSI